MLFIMLLVSKRISYTAALSSFVAILLVCSIIGGVLNLVILSFAVRYALKKQFVVVISTVYLLAIIASCWIFNVYVIGVVLFFSAWLPQVSVALHGSQIPFISTVDLQFA